MLAQEVVIIGAGQAGLAMSHVLSCHGIEHVVLERGRIGERWLGQRWPSLRLLTPNWMTRLPGFSYSGPDRDGFMAGTEFARLLQDYATAIGAPVIGDVEVLSVQSGATGFIIRTSRGSMTARAVVVATGACQKSAVPAFARHLAPDIAGIVPDTYHSPGALPDGNVLVVGASATGIQLAREIHLSGRNVTLAVGRHVRSPRQYRGRDIMYWLDASGFLTDPCPADADPLKLMAQPSLQLVGDGSGGDLHLSTLDAMGVRIVGRAIGADGNRLFLANDLQHEIDAAERRREKLLDAIDDYIAASDRSAAARPATGDAPTQFGATPTELDLAAERIGSIVWATGYRRDYDWLRLPVQGPTGEISHAGGVTAVPGLYVIGLPYLRHRSSSFIDGVGQDARVLGAILAARLRARSARAA